jgi:hypothetical protein
LLESRKPQGVSEEMMKLANGDMEISNNIERAAPVNL